MSERVKAEARVLVDITRARMAFLQGYGAKKVTAPIFVNSLPKSGTNLLLELMRALPGMHEVRLKLTRKQAGIYRPRVGEPSVLAGVTTPAEMSLGRLARTLGRLPPGTWFRGHVPYSEAFRDLLAALDVKVVLMLRDPRDVVVSSAAYLPFRPGNRFSAHFRSLSEADRVLASITGLPACEAHPELLGIGERVHSVRPWMSEPFVYVSRFERLVGPAGGGSEHFQVTEIRNIAEHIGTPLSQEEARHLATGLFGGTHTFRKGQIGAWREVFTERHMRAAKPLLDDLLVELGYETTTAWSSS
ncbi:MAG: sulfotransferase domain-containing protein [Egibacteraceae bacterium]